MNGFRDSNRDCNRGGNIEPNISQAVKISSVILANVVYTKLRINDNIKNHQ